MLKAEIFLVTRLCVARSSTSVDDCGHKGIAVDNGMPLVSGQPGIEYTGPYDEHGTRTLDASADKLAIGERLRLIPGHCDPTVDRYDW